MSTVVISQPLLFPWPGHFELFSTADIYVHLDDVQFPNRSFINRVQIKQAGGVTWMTIPIKERGSRPLIMDMISEDTPWRRRHRELLRHALSRAPHLNLALELFDRAYARNKIVDLLIEGIEGAAKFLGLSSGRSIIRSSALHITDAGSDRILAIVRALGGTRYITAHGAANYLDHGAFENEGIKVEYVDYSRSDYKQLHGAFTPYVSTLDLIANTGSEASQYLRPRLVPWREFLATRGNAYG